MDLDRDEIEQDKLEYSVSQNQKSKNESKNSKTEYDQSKGQSVENKLSNKRIESDDRTSSNKVKDIYESQHKT